MEKEKIYYNRTYRRMKLNWRGSFIFWGLIVLPVLLFYLVRMEAIIGGIIKISYLVLSQVMPTESIQILTTQYSKFWSIAYLALPTSYPQPGTIWLHLIGCLILLLIINWRRKSGGLFAVFFWYAMLVHLVNCVFFLFAKNSFPYTIADYSELYLKQQIGIFLMFLIMGGMVFGCWGNVFLKIRIAAFAGICIYSLLFGTVRYILFLFLLYRYSVILMAGMFFVIGPMVDFAYFVAIYAAYMNKMTRAYGKGEKRGEWVWS